MVASVKNYLYIESKPSKIFIGTSRSLSSVGRICHIRVMKALFSILILCCSLSGASTKKLTVFSLYDDGGYYYDTSKKRAFSKAKILKKILHAQRGSYPKCLTFLGGDILMAQRFADEKESQKWIEFLNTFPIDASVIGNHELDNGVSHFEKMRNHSQFKWLGANLIDSSSKCIGSEAQLLSYHINDVHIAVIGLSHIPHTTNEFYALPAVRSAKKLIKRLPKTVDFIIALTHLNAQQAMILGRQIGKINLIITQDYKDPSLIYDQGTWIVTQNNFRSHLAKIDITMEKDRQNNIELFPVFTVYYPEEGLKEASHEIEAKKHFKELFVFSEPVSTTPEALGRQNPLADMIADSMCKLMKADAAVFPAGMLRGMKQYKKGDTFYLADLYQECLFNNRIAMIKMKGVEIKKLLEMGVKDYENSTKAFIHGANISYKITKIAPKMTRVSSILINKEPLELNREYQIATIDYVAEGRGIFSWVKRPASYHSKRLVPILSETLSKKDSTFSKEAKIVIADGVKPPPSGVGI